MLDNWSLASLEELVDVLDHLRIPVNSDERARRPGKVPYYGANGQQGWIDRPLFDEPLILLAEDGGNFDDFRTRPIAYRIAGPSWVNNHAHIIRAQTGVNQSFIFWSLVHKDIRRYIAGGTRSKLTQTELRTIELDVPPLPEQRRIAEILDTLDEAIRKTEQVIAKLQQMKQGLLHDLLTRGIDENGELRDPERHPEQFKDTPLGQIPREWEIRALTTAAELDRGKFTHRPRNDPRFYGGEIPFIQTGDITAAQGGFISSFSQTLNTHGAAVSRQFPKKTIAITIAANIADTAILSIPMYFPDSIVGAIVQPPNSVRFVELSIRKAKPRLEAQAPQSAQKNINLQDLRPLPVAFPGSQEQCRIAQVYEAHIQRERNEEVQLQKLRTLKHGLMDDLLTGRVRVNIPGE